MEPVRAELYATCEREDVGMTVMKGYAGGRLLSAEASPFGVALAPLAQCIHYALDAACCRQHHGGRDRRWSTLTMRSLTSGQAKRSAIMRACLPARHAMLITGSAPTADIARRAFQASTFTGEQVLRPCCHAGRGASVRSSALWAFRVRRHLHALPARSAKRAVLWRLRRQAYGAGRRAVWVLARSCALESGCRPPAL